MHDRGVRGRIHARDPFNLLLDHEIRGRIHAGKFPELVELLRNTHRINSMTWAVQEVMLNDPGYRIMANKAQMNGAIAVFTLNTEPYPKSAHAPVVASVDGRMISFCRSRIAPTLSPAGHPWVRPLQQEQHKRVHAIIDKMPTTIPLEEILMKYRRLFLLVAVIVISACDAFSDLPRKEFEITKLAEGVYAFVWKDPMQNPVEGNSLFVINENDVLVVDAGLFPSSTRVMIRELQKLTAKPVRYVVNTHFHDDHVNGNFVYREFWPDVEVVSHRDTRTDIIEQVDNVRDNDIQNMIDSRRKYEGWLSTGKDDSGTPLDDARKKRAAELTELFRRSVDEYRTVKNAPPSITFTDSLVLYRGDRIIKIMWLGLGNTRGDGVVYLPHERIAAIGDLCVYPVPFGIGSYYREWITTLGRIDSLQADVLLPGHGPLQHDRIYLRQVQQLLGVLVSRVDSAVASGLTLEQTQDRVTLPDWMEKFAGNDPSKERSFKQFFLLPAVERAWHQAKGDADGH